MRVSQYPGTGTRRALTNNQGNHGGSISPGSLQALDQLLDLPDFDVLLRLVGLGVTHYD
jgi:hypothetical protein